MIHQPAQRIILASASPRRREILSKWLAFTVIPSTFAEDLNKSDFETADEYVLENSRLKAKQVFDQMSVFSIDFGFLTSS